jgi:hypothetical protein
MRFSGRAREQSAEEAGILTLTPYFQLLSDSTQVIHSIHQSVYLILSDLILSNLVYLLVFPPSSPSHWAIRFPRMAAAASIEELSILGRHSIHLGFHLAEHIVSTVTAHLPASAYVLVTDANIAAKFLPLFQKEFDAVLAAKTGARFLSYQIAPGEASKNRKTKADIEDWLLKHRCTRDTVILALGGGVVGDLTGFVAATFMRGVRYCQIPTTLLAMVDSAVGGKVSGLAEARSGKQAQMHQDITNLFLL